MKVNKPSSRIGPRTPISTGKMQAYLRSEDKTLFSTPQGIEISRLIDQYISNTVGKKRIIKLLKEMDDNLIAKESQQDENCAPLQPSSPLVSYNEVYQSKGKPVSSNAVKSQLTLFRVVSEDAKSTNTSNCSIDLSTVSTVKLCNSFEENDHENSGISEANESISNKEIQATCLETELEANEISNVSDKGADTDILLSSPIPWRPDELSSPDDNDQMTAGAK